MSDKRKYDNPLGVTGKETGFEALQVVMAALTLRERGEAEGAAGIEAVLLLNPRTAVKALWITLGAFTAGFDSVEDKVHAIQVVARVIAEHEAEIVEGLG